MVAEKYPPKALIKLKTDKIIIKIRHLLILSWKLTIY